VCVCVCVWHYGAAPNRVFSAASITAATNYLTGSFATCLSNSFPSWAPAYPACGNGVVEPGEACDPGAQVDSCCTATCQLVAGCLCGTTQPCCTASGRFKAAGTVCRAARSATCDLAETCTGLWGMCPMDLYAPVSVCAVMGC
jgi:hypothetical protein